MVEGFWLGFMNTGSNGFATTCRYPNAVKYIRNAVEVFRSWVADGNGWKETVHCLILRGIEHADLEETTAIGVGEQAVEGDGTTVR